MNLWLLRLFAQLLFRRSRMNFETLSLIFFFFSLNWKNENVKSIRGYLLHMLNNICRDLNMEHLLMFMCISLMSRMCSLCSFKLLWHSTSCPAHILSVTSFHNNYYNNYCKLSVLFLFFHFSRLVFSQISVLTVTECNLLTQLCSCATLDSLAAFSFFSMNIFQVYFHCHLHFWVSDKDICARILYSAVHLLERPMELAGLQRHSHGVSNDIIHIPSYW